MLFSVGFDNSAGHVRQEVFDLLKKYHLDHGRLVFLKCTQFTAACLASQTLPREGPFSDPFCAGDIEVTLAPDAGPERVQVRTVPDEHPGRVTALDQIGSPQCKFLSAVQSATAPSEPAPTDATLPH